MRKSIVLFLGLTLSLTSHARSCFNALDRDSFDVAAAGVKTCINVIRAGCDVSASGLKTPSLDEGVGVLQFKKIVTGATYRIVGYKLPPSLELASQLSVKVMEITDVPASVTFSQAVLAFYTQPTSSLMKSCIWK